MWFKYVYLFEKNVREMKNKVNQCYFYKFYKFNTLTYKNKKTCIIKNLFSKQLTYLLIYLSLRGKIRIHGIIKVAKKTIDTLSIPKLAILVLCYKKMFSLWL